MHLYGRYFPIYGPDLWRIKLTTLDVLLLRVNK